MGHAHQHRFHSHIRFAREDHPGRMSKHRQHLLVRLSRRLLCQGQSRGRNCDIEAYYLGSAPRVYSLDESGHLQVRAPMVYLNQIFASFENATIKEFEVRFTSINNAHCNANPSHEHLDDMLSVSHLSYCDWTPEEGATIPTSDEPLLEGDVEEAFFSLNKGTVGPFIDLPAPINPFTITPTPSQAEEPASGATTEAAASESSSASSRGLLITLGAGAMLLLLAAAVESPGHGAARANRSADTGRYLSPLALTHQSKE